MGCGGGTAAPNDQKNDSDERNFSCETWFHRIWSHGLKTAALSREITPADRDFTESSIPVWGIK